jgi:hypothetical protein
MSSRPHVGNTNSAEGLSTAAGRLLDAGQRVAHDTTTAINAQNAAASRTL